MHMVYSHSVEVANSLNPPEGFLVQARNGTEDSSEIIGTFLDPSVVSARNPTVPVNYKILQCRSHQDSDEGPLDVSTKSTGYVILCHPPLPILCPLKFLFLSELSHSSRHSEHGWDTSAILEST